MLLPITLTTAGAAALIALWLGLRCVMVRVKASVMQGDGGNPLLARRMRAQANFVEYTPFALILIGLIEYAQGPRPWLWAAAIVYLAARLIHPFGLERDGNNAPRAIGIFATWGVLLVLALYALYLPYVAGR